MSKNKKPGHQVFVVTLAAAVLLHGSFLMARLLILCPLSVLPDSEWTQLAAAYLPFIVLGMAVCCYVRFAETELFSKLASPDREGKRGSTAYIALSGLFFGLGIAICCAAAAMVHGDFTLSFAGFEPLFLVVSFVCVFLQSTAEEILFRGYVLGALRERYGLVFALLVNPLMFMLAHAANAGVTPAALLTSYTFGFCMSVFTSSLNSVWFAVLAHAGWNYMQNLLLGLPNSGLMMPCTLFRLNPGAISSLWYDTVFGLEGGITPIILFPLLTALVLLIWRKNYKR